MDKCMGVCVSTYEKHGQLLARGEKRKKKTCIPTLQN